MSERVPVAGPSITEREIELVLDAARNGWYGNANLFQSRFEREFAQWVGVPYAISLPSCTAGIHLALADLAGARTLLREIDDVLRRRPDLGTLIGQARALRARLAGERGPVTPGASALTAAELRLLPLLATHLSLAEIAAELAISHNTVKSQTASLYRKLIATSREEAVARSRELSLLDG